MSYTTHIPHVQTHTNVSPNSTSSCGLFRGFSPSKLINHSPVYEFGLGYYFTGKKTLVDLRQHTECRGTSLGASFRSVCPSPQLSEMLAAKAHSPLHLGNFRYPRHLTCHRLHRFPGAILFF